VNVSPELREFLVDYIEHHRHDVVDEYGREALFTTSAGRVSTATIRRDYYKMTRPCIHSNGCPHGRDPSDCDAAKNKHAPRCPFGFETHPLRQWAIMNQLDAGMLKELLSDRVDVSVPVLDKHYDQRTEERKSKRRREELEKHLTEYSDA